jgi:DNA-binding beta-propeller fold protein YncE
MRGSQVAVCGDNVADCGRSAGWVPAPVAAILLLALLLLVTLPADFAQAQTPDNEVLTEFCEGGGNGAGRCMGPRGIAVDPSTGDAYVADLTHRRVQKFTAWGEFIRAWGWDVVASGPGDDTSVPEDGFEICVPANGDECKAGLAGPNSGQFGEFSTGLAIDSSGDVYVVDQTNQRVQKFGPDGNFLLMFGGQVNKTKVDAAAPEAEQNRCPIDPGDVCQAGSKGTGPGQFGNWRIGSFIAASPGDTVYVGDEGRIQKFDPQGQYLGNLPDPSGLVAANTVQSLALDPGSGDLYVAFHNKGFVAGEANPPNVHRLDGDTGAVLDTLAVGIPSAVAVDGAGHVYAFDGDATGSTSEPGNHFLRILEFDSGGSLTGVFDRNALPNIPDGSSGDRFTAISTGLATSSACGIEGTDLFVSNPNPSNSFVRIYGPPPDVEVCPPPPKAPDIKEQHALSVDSEGALVRAQVNPNFWPDTTYYVEYGTGECSAGGCTQTALFPGVLVGAGTVKRFVTKGAFLGAEEPLTPDTVYHYRFVAQSSGGGPTFGEEKAFRTFPSLALPKTDCPNQEFRTGASAHLPDCRAYEMVSPVDKGNSDVSNPRDGGAHDMSSATGDKATWTVLATAFGNPQGAPFAHQYLSSRDPASGWQTHSIATPRDLPSLYENLSTVDNQFRGFSDDLCSAWVIQDTDVPLAPGAPADVPNLYQRHNCGPLADTYSLITTVAPTEPAPGFSEALEPQKSAYYLHPLGSSADGSLTVFRSPAKLTLNASSEDLRQVYAYKDGELHVVSLIGNGNPVKNHASVGTWEGHVSDFTTASVHNAVAEDGSRIFWSVSESLNDKGKAFPSRESGGSYGGVDAGSQLGPLYVRLNPTEPQSARESGRCTEAEKACTIEINDGTARFLTAAADGSHAVYSVGEELFEFDVEKAITLPGAQVPQAQTLIAKGVQGVLGASEDASRIYLVSEEALDTGATAGEPNLYLYERGVGFDFIAELSSLDTSLVGSIPSAINNDPGARTSRVTADGLHAAFTSTAPLTGYDNTDAQSGEPDAEAFLYDAVAGELICASCNPSGVRPSGREVASPISGSTALWAAARLPGWISQLHPGRLLSADGSRLFFESFESLVPRDVNGKQDVYEWQAVTSKAQCLGELGLGGELYVPTSSGCLSLISSGQSLEDSQLMDASADGSDVFFSTTHSLLEQDFGLRDVYDARVNGGFPAPEVVPPECEGEACQGTAATPEGPTPASESAGGPALPAARPCPSGKRRVVRRGESRCVARRCPKGKRRVRPRGKDEKARCVPKKRKQGQHKRRSGASRRVAR